MFLTPSLRSHKKEKKRQWELVRQVQYSNSQAREGTQNQHKTQQVQQVRE